MRKLRFVVTTNRPVNVEELAKKVAGEDEKKNVEVTRNKIGDLRPIVTIKGAAAKDLLVAIEFFEGGVDEIDFIIDE